MAHISMLRLAHFKGIRGIRFNSKASISKFPDVTIDLEPRSHSQQLFGELVQDNETDRVIDRNQLLSQSVYSPYRDETGSLRHGINSHEARLLPETLQGRTYREQLELNPVVSQVIQNNILSLHLPNNIRRSAANYFVQMHNEKLHRPAKTTMDVDSHIAAIFLQNYGSIFQSLAELKKRVGPSFQPKRILDVGFGPATGIVALNELMGDNFSPELRDAVVLSSIEMQKRAKVILSRQLSEVSKEVTNNNIGTTEEEPDEISEGEDLVGEVMTKKININTRLRSTVPNSGNYDLIILTHQLLRDEERFPIQIDDNLEYYLKMLSPGGHIVIVERGNPLGFEIVSRARQVMIRPENYPEEHGKIPRPFMRGSSVKRRTPVGLNDTQIDEEAEKLIQEINSRHGEVQVEDLEFETELQKEMQGDEEEHLNYHLKIIAPCPHHRKCPLQVGNPRYYEYDEGRKLKFCNFQKSIMRPKFSIELKKGKILATRWQEPTDGIGIEGLAKGGTGRPNGRNYEVLNYSYLIAQRSFTDPETISQIEREREEETRNYDIGSLGNGTQDTWPRIINQPIKRKGHVTMDLCGSSGQVEKWVVPKSFSKEIYHDARKATKGDLWGLQAKTKIKGAANLKVDKFEKLEKERIKKERMALKKQDREITEMYNEIEGHDESYVEEVESLAEVYGYDYARDSKRKEKLYNKRKPNVNV